MGAGEIFASVNIACISILKVSNTIVVYDMRMDQRERERVCVFW